MKLNKKSAVKQSTTKQTVAAKKPAAKPAAKVTGHNYITNRHNLRLNYESVGVGLMSSGSYVLNQFDRNEADRLVEMSKNKLQGKKRAFQMLHSGNGMLLREVSQIDATHYLVNGKLMSTGMFHPNEVKLLSAKELGDLVRKEGSTGEVRVKRNKEQLTGVILGDLSRPYASMLYVKNGKLHVKDIEAKSNSHNAQELCAITSSGNDPKIKATVLAKL